MTMAAKTCAEIYPDFEGGYGPCDYGPILESFGKILVRVDDDDYQGDSRVLYEDGDRVGFLKFGWGSCSGCDALQAAETIAEVDALIAELRGQIQWKARAEMREYFQSHDWEGDYDCHSNEAKSFVEQAIVALS